MVYRSMLRDVKKKRGKKRRRGGGQVAPSPTTGTA